MPVSQRPSAASSARIPRRLGGHLHFLHALLLTVSCWTGGRSFSVQEFCTPPKVRRGRASRWACSGTSTLPKTCLANSPNGHNKVVNNNNNDADDDSSKSNDKQQSSSTSQRLRFRERVYQLTKSLAAPIRYAAPMPQAVAALLKDATMDAVDLAVDEVLARRNRASLRHQHRQDALSTEANDVIDLDMTTLIDEAFGPLEASLQEVERQLSQTRQTLSASKAQALETLEMVQAAVVAQVRVTEAAVEAAKEKVRVQVLTDLMHETNLTQVVASPAANTTSMLSPVLADLDFNEDEMAPPFLDEDSCLVPGEPLVRVEKAPDNCRRIFAGIDIYASVDAVWAVLTDYAHLSQVVPNLVVNDVLERYDGDANASDVVAAAAAGDAATVETITADTGTSSTRPIQTQQLALQLRGAKLAQVGGAKVAGLQFSARTTLDVREWPHGLPLFATLHAKDAARVPAQRHVFPRPFALSRLPTRDITMQSVEDDNGEFRLYQGVWRLQPLPGCAPPGQEAMRLTYAVEVAPRPYLPVSIVQGRLVKDLCTNLEAIRDFVSNAPSSTGTSSSLTALAEDAATTKAVA